MVALAEVAVGLAGFSSVVVVFRRRSSYGAWKPDDAFRRGRGVASRPTTTTVPGSTIGSWSIGTEVTGL
jgi:hypothetical protein